MAATITAIEPLGVRVSGKTVWSFVRVAASDGLTGYGEATVHGFEPELWAVALWFAVGCVGRSADPREGILPVPGAAPRPLVREAVASAIDLALWNMEGQRRGMPLRDFFGRARRDAIALYANINRRTRDRHPSGFGASAAIAVAQGYDMIKIAPFDGLEPAIVATAHGRRAIERGLKRIAAVRDTVGPQCRILVDCHWRFDEASAAALLRQLAPLGIFWLECPLPEEPERFAEIRRLRHLANGLGIRLAGCELQSKVEGFRPFIEAGLYDVVMPDVKYAGGLAEMLRIAEFAGAHGVACSPHNPTGPIGHAASLQICALLADFPLPLELQFEESSLFRSICRGLPEPSGAASRLPDGAGLGVVLDEAAIGKARWTPSGPASEPFAAAFFNKRGIGA